MKNTRAVQDKIMDLPALKNQVAGWRVKGKTIAFTNGCFDLLHEGHIYSLSQAAATADFLVVGVNADESVKKLKGPSRPVNHESSRALVLASLLIVDAVIIFNEETPQELISTLLPDVLVKGGDYTVNEIAGAKEVIGNGGKLVLNPVLEGFSTTSIISKMAKPGNDKT